MPQIFISYRRADSQTITDRIHDRLVTAFGDRNVFQDVYDIKFGEDFRKVLGQQVTACDVVLVIIGPTWATIRDDSKPDQQVSRTRLENPDDVVRIEVESGLNHAGSIVIPVLVSDSQMPKASDLPASLKPLCYLNAVTVRNNPYFEDDIRRLIARLQELDEPKKQVLRWVKGIIAAGVLLAVVFAVALFARSGILVPSAAETLTSPTVEITPNISITDSPVPTRSEPVATATLVVQTPSPMPVGSVATRTASVDSGEMVEVPAGCFMMGDAVVNRQFEMCIQSPYLIGKYEVTNAAYRACVEVNQCEEPVNSIYYDIDTFANYPVVHIDWFQAKAYAEWRGGRLPSECQWEYAARGPENSIYPWGDTYNSGHVNAGVGQTVSYTQGVMTAESVQELGGVSWSGADAMSGNVWEWTSSIKLAYPFDAVRAWDPQDKSQQRVARGGSWRNTSDFVRLWHRSSGLLPSAQEDDLGFRIILPVDNNPLSDCVRP